MVASRVGIDLRRPAEFAHQDDQRGFKQSPLRKVLEQRRVGHVQLREQRPLQRREVLAVRVPVQPPFGHSDEAHTRFNQAPRKQASLSHRGPPVAVADRFLFLLDIESLLCSR